MVGGRRLAGEEERARRHLEARVLPQPVVEHDHAQRVQQLPLVFVDALDLAVEDRVGIDAHAGRRLEPFAQTRLGLALGVADGVAKAGVVGERRELRELGEVGDPAVADRLGDAAGERRIGQQQPAPRGHAVGLVVEALGEHLGEVPDGHRAQQLGMDGGDAVGAVRADDGEIGHPDLALAALLDEAHARDPALVAGKARPHLLEEAAVDLEDDLEVPRQQQLEPAQRPLLQGLGQQRVVRVGERPPGEVPGLVPAEARLVEQDPHQLGHGQARMGVVELDRDLVGERAPVGIAPAEAPHEIRERAGDEEILLHEAQPLPHAGGVVGIEHPRQGFGRRAARPVR